MDGLKRYSSLFDLHFYVDRYLKNSICKKFLQISTAPTKAASLLNDPQHLVLNPSKGFGVSTMKFIHRHHVKDNLYKCANSRFLKHSSSRSFDLLAFQCFRGVWWGTDNVALQATALRKWRSCCGLDGRNIPATSERLYQAHHQRLPHLGKSWGGINAQPAALTIKTQTLALPQATNELPA